MSGRIRDAYAVLEGMVDILTIPNDLPKRPPYRLALRIAVALIALILVYGGRVLGG